MELDRLSVATYRPIDVVLSHAQRARREGRGWMVECPAHRDLKPSLHINEADDGSVLLKCFAGCSTEAILAMWGIEPRQLFPPEPASNGKRHVVATYPYRARTGEVVYEVVRYSPKDFRCRRPDGRGGWEWRLNGVERLHFRLPELLTTDPSQLIFYSVSEKDVLCLVDAGLVATCHAGGDGKAGTVKDWSWASGRHVVVLPHNDASGRSGAEEVARLVQAAGGRSKVVELPDLPAHGDVVDWFAVGHTAAELRALTQPQPASVAALAFGLEAFPQPELEQAELSPGVERAGRARLYDLSRFSTEGEAALLNWLIPEWIERGKIHLTAGREKRGKTSKALRRAAAVSTGTSYLDGRPAQLGRAVLVTEMDEAGILQLIEDDAIVLDWSRCRIVFTNEYAPEERLGAIEDVCRAWPPDWLGLDPIDECFGLDGEGIFNPSRSAAPFDLMRTLARTGISIDGLYHLNNLGKIANSYKFKTKPDHLYEMSGEDASDVTVKYRGRLRVIPRVRRITGNGLAGYRVETIVGGQKSSGRPADTIDKVLAVLRSSAEPLGPKAVAARATNLSEEAARAGLNRLVASGRATKLDRGLYTAREELDL